MKEYDVYGVGNALVDLIVEVNDDFFLNNGVEKGVMTLVDEERQTHLMRSISTRKAKTMAGGSAANTVIGIAQLGGRTAYSFSTARDELGKIFIEDMKRNGVHTNVRYEDCPPGHSGRCLVMVSPDAERTMNTFLGESVSLSSKHIDEEAVKRSAYVYLEGYLVATKGGVEAMCSAKKMAEQNHTRTAITLSDPNMVKFFPRRFDKVIGKGVDFLFCNEQEALMYSKTKKLREACQKLQQIAKSFVVTRGKKGSLVYDGTAFLQIEPHKAEKVLDTNGAGDTFAGGFLYGLTRGRSYGEAGRIASVVASRVVSQFGPRLEPGEAKRALSEAGCVLAG